MAALRRYAAFLRGVSPMNLKMAALKGCLEGEGFSDVRTVLTSGNVVFGARARSERALETRLEQAMGAALGRTFATHVRSLDELRAMLDADPYAAYRLSSGAKRVVTFLRDVPELELSFPREAEGTRILCRHGREVFTAYVESPRGAVFMRKLEKAFGTDITTRTWDTVKKVVGAHGRDSSSARQHAST